MPIYAYRCTSCGFEKDHLQKLSDPVLTTCPECGAASLRQASLRRLSTQRNGLVRHRFQGRLNDHPGTEVETGRKRVALSELCQS